MNPDVITSATHPHSIQPRHPGLAQDTVQQAAVAAALRTLRVRARLSAVEQHRFDDLLGEPVHEELLALIVGHDESEALELVRRRIAAASVAHLIGRLRAGLTDEEHDRLVLRLPQLSLREQRSLAAHLRTMTPADAAMLLRGYLVSARA